jgi:hypothetical protein
MIVFKKGRKDEEFSPIISDRLLSRFGQGEASLRKAVADLMNESELLDVNDDDIEDCTVIANLNGKRHTIHMFENGSFATKFPIAVPMNSDGHPLAEPTKSSMLKLLKDEIISRGGHV